MHSKLVAPLRCGQKHVDEEPDGDQGKKESQTSSFSRPELGLACNSELNWLTEGVKSFETLTNV